MPMAVPNPVPGLCMGSVCNERWWRAYNVNVVYAAHSSTVGSPLSCWACSGSGSPTMVHSSNWGSAPMGLPSP